MISRRIAAEINRIVSLCQTLGVLNRNSFPALAAIHRDVVITCITWPWRTSGLKGSGDNVVRIPGVDCDGNFSGIDCVRIADSDDLLCESHLRKQANKNQHECSAQKHNIQMPIPQPWKQ